MAEALLAGGANPNTPTGQRDKADNSTEEAPATAHGAGHAARSEARAKEAEEDEANEAEEEVEEEARSPLMLAVAGRLHAAVELLLGHGADAAWVSGAATQSSG